MEIIRKEASSSSVNLKKFDRKPPISDVVIPFILLIKNLPIPTDQMNFYYYNYFKKEFQEKRIYFKKQ